MNVKIDKSFEKDTNKITDSKSLQKLAIIINQCVEANSIQEIQNLKKLKEYQNYYRIKMGQYRLGFRLENNEIIFERILHRKDIYKKFP